jgi:hypothetical protein
MLLAVSRVTPLRWIKLLHTIIWFFFASCIVVLPILGYLRRFRAAAWLTAVVFAECAILALNQFRCPLTDLASHYTSDWTANFDIFLPLWLAQHNQSIFGTLFFAGVLFVLGCYFSVRR